MSKIAKNNNLEGKTQGRPKGSPNKASKALKDMILGALDDAGGQDYLARQAEENPGPFMGLIGKVLPKEIKAEVEHSGGIDVSHTIDFLDAIQSKIDAARKK